jgi:hypothetical protein
LNQLPKLSSKNRIQQMLAGIGESFAFEKVLEVHQIFALPGPSNLNRSIRCAWLGHSLP